MTGVDLSAASWRKSSYSGGGSEDNCVEVATLPATIALRDSKAPHSGALTVTPSAWAYFRAALRAD